MQAKPARKSSVDQKKAKPTPANDEMDEEGEFEACVQGLDFNAYEADIRELFEECGEITEFRLLTKPDGRSKGTAFLKFNRLSALNKALELNGAEHMGRNIKV